MNLQSFLLSILLVFSSLASANPLMEAVAEKYNNMMTHDRVQDQGDSEFIKPMSAKDLPIRVLARVQALDISLYQDGDELVGGGSQYVIFNNENDSGTFDTFVVLRPDGKAAGYAFNVAVCTIEECYGWEALYLGPQGKLIYRSFH